APPERMTSASPARISAAAYEIASVELVQPVEMTWLMPCNSSAIEISLEIMPTIATGIPYGATRFQPSPKNSPYCRSATSIPPAPLPTSTPAFGSLSRRPASAHASRAAMTAISEALEYRLGSARPGCGASPARSVMMVPSSMVTAGTGAATVQGNGDASESRMRGVALQPPLTCRQKQSRPTPEGDAT